MFGSDNGNGWDSADREYEKVVKLKNQLKIALIALNEIKKDQWILMRKDIDKIKEIAVKAITDIKEVK